MTLKKETVLNFLSKKKNFLKDVYGIERISLFGSFARGEESENSDVDLLVEMNEPTFSKLAGLKVYLEEEFNREVNVVRKHSRLKPRFLKIINQDLVNVS